MKRWNSDRTEHTAKDTHTHTQQQQQQQKEKENNPLNFSTRNQIFIQQRWQADCMPLLFFLCLLFFSLFYCYCCFSCCCCSIKFILYGMLHNSILVCHSLWLQRRQQHNVNLILFIDYIQQETLLLLLLLLLDCIKSESKNLCKENKMQSVFFSYST